MSESWSPPVYDPNYRPEDHQISSEDSDDLSIEGVCRQEEPQREPSCEPTAPLPDGDIDREEDSIERAVAEDIVDERQREEILEECSFVRIMPRGARRIVPKLSAKQVLLNDPKLQHLRKLYLQRERTYYRLVEQRRKDQLKLLKNLDLGKACELANRSLKTRPDQRKRHHDYVNSQKISYAQSLICPPLPSPVIPSPVVERSPKFRMDVAHHGTRRQSHSPDAAGLFGLNSDSNSDMPVRGVGRDLFGASPAIMSNAGLGFDYRFGTPSSGRDLHGILFSGDRGIAGMSLNQFDDFALAPIASQLASQLATPCAAGGGQAEDVGGVCGNLPEFDASVFDNIDGFFATPADWYTP